MMKLTPCALLAFAVASASGLPAYGQALPADTGTAPPPGIGFSLPNIGGSFSYAVSVGELISSGFFNDSGVGATTNFSGDLAYVSKSERHPFSAVYSGGLLLENSGQPTTYYQSLSFSQVLSTPRWNVVASDSISYLPESPVVGLSGIPGVGDLGVDPISVSPIAPGIGILTTYGPRISNTVGLSVSRNLTAKLSAQASGNYSIQRFIGDNASQGIDTSSAGGTAGLNYRLTGRDSLAGAYSYSRFSYPGLTGNFNTQSGTINYSRQWTPRLSTNVGAGPQVSSGDGGTLSGSYLSVTAAAGATYISQLTTYSLNYTRGTNNGSGVLPGSFSDNLTLSAHRQFGRDWQISGDIGYSRSTSLPIFELGTFKSDGVAFGLQASRAFGRYISAYGNYTVEDQSTSGTGIGITAANAFNGVYQVLGFGVTYSPRHIPLSK